VFNVIISHDKLPGGEDRWTVPARPYYENIRDADMFAIVFFAEDLSENPDAKMIDWVVLPKEGFNFIRSKTLEGD
jgi:hypothetical protein